MPEELGERTEKPSERRLQEARSRGQVARSADFSSAVILSAAVLVVMIFGRTILEGMADLVRFSLSDGVLGAGADQSRLVPDLRMSALAAARAVAPAALALVCVGFAGSILQVGWHPSVEPLEPKWSKLNVVKGFGNLFSRRSGVKGGLDVLKFVIVAAVAVYVVSDEHPEILALANLDLGSGFLRCVQLVERLALWVLAVLIVLGLIDFKYQRWQHNQDLRMTKQEVKEDRKAADGDMEVKGRRLKLARQIALQRIGASVPKADVVVTNPTHYAVALRYSPDKGMRAPKVVAKGADFLALKMRYIAAASGVPIVERAPLARALYHNIPVGREISSEHYEAVAEVLAYVYRINNNNTNANSPQLLPS